MRVVFANKYYFPPHLGGVEQSLNLLARSLARRPGIDVAVVVANEGRRTVRESLDGVSIVRAARLLAVASTPVAPSFRRELARAAREPVPADVVHLNFPYPWGETAWLASGLRTPSVLTYHADVVRQRRLMTLYAPILRRVLDRVDRIIVGSPQLVETSPFLAPVAEKCRVVPFAIDSSRFGPDPSAEASVSRAVGDGSGPVTLFVGRLVYYKGVDVLLRAFVDVPGTLVVVGAGPLEGELKALAVELGIGHRVRWLAPAPDAVLGALYRRADVFCLPSVERTEAYGLVQLEAHHAGLPVVSTDLPTGVPFVNEHGVTGLVVRPGDPGSLSEALSTLHADDELRARLGRQARDRANSDFSLDAMVEGTLSVYREAQGLRT